MNLNDAIRSIVNPLIKSQLITGKVTQFFPEDYTCEIEFDKRLKLDQVKIKSVLNSEESGIYIKPKIGSIVVVGLIDNKLENIFIACFSEIDEIYFKSPLIKLNGDELGGIVKSEKVASEDKKIIDEINKLKQILSLWVPVPTDGGTALKTALASWFTPLVSDVKANYENSTVKHG